MGSDVTHEEPPQARKFKAKDKVRVTANHNGHGFPIGEIVEIVGVGEDDYTAYYLDGSDFWWVEDDELELVAPATREGGA